MPSRSCSFMNEIRLFLNFSRLAWKLGYNVSVCFRIISCIMFAYRLCGFAENLESTRLGAEGPATE